MATTRLVVAALVLPLLIVGTVVAAVFWVTAMWRRTRG